MYEKVIKASDIVWFLRRQWSQLRKQKDARKAHGNTQCEHLSVKWNRGYVTHGIEATCASPNGIEAKCASPRWRPSPEIDWHRDRYLRAMINPAGRNHVNRQRSPSSNAIIIIIRSRGSLENHTRFQTIMVKIYTSFQTKTAQKPYPLGRHIPI